MSRATKYLLSIVCTLLSIAACVDTAIAQGTSVSLQVKMQMSQRDSGTHAPQAAAANSVVAWLIPLGPVEAQAPRANTPIHSFVLTQKDKQFIPHLLVIPTGSSVEFPNLDPFFHNVFSLFNGRRFDLGLYEEGSRRTVRFDHDGISYIFCNIHPEMGAVIVSLSTPYYTLSDRQGSIVLTNVPAGDYELHLWSEDVSASDLAQAQRRIHVADQPLHLSAATLNGTTSPLKHHLDKFGEEYKNSTHAPY